MADDLAFTSTLDAARGGDACALEHLYHRYSPRVAGYLRSHGVSDTGGCTNDVFLRVFRHLDGFEGDEARFRSWMFTIAHHRMVDELRRAARRPQIDDRADLDGAGGGDAEEEALAAMGRQRVDELLACLSPDQRAVVVLRVVEDLPIEAVGEALGKRPTAVKALQHRALAALRRRLAGEEVSP